MNMQFDVDSIDLSTRGPIYKISYDTLTGTLCLRSGVRTELPAERHLPGRECGITASPALRVIGRSHRAGDATYNDGRRTAPSPSQHRAPGTVCRTRSVAAHLWLSSSVHSKLTFIFSVFINTVFNLLSVRAPLT